MAPQRVNPGVRGPASGPATLPTMRPALAAFTCALALGAPLGLTACGGDERPYDAVPATTPELLPPDDANDIASALTGKSGSTTSQASGQQSQGAAPSAGTGGAAPATGTGGAAAPGPATPTPAPATGGGTAPGSAGAAPDTGGVSPEDSAAAGSVQQFCAAQPRRLLSAPAAPLRSWRLASSGSSLRRPAAL